MVLEVSRQRGKIVKCSKFAPHLALTGSIQRPLFRGKPILARGETGGRLGNYGDPAAAMSDPKRVRGEGGFAGKFYNYDGRPSGTLRCCQSCAQMILVRIARIIPAIICVAALVFVNHGSAQESDPSEGVQTETKHDNVPSTSADLSPSTGSDCHL
jgi:hypothetical protein